MQLSKRLIKEKFLNNLKSPATEFYTLSVAAIKGLSALEPSLDLDVVMSFFYEINESKCNFHLEYIMFSDVYTGIYDL